MEEFDARRAAMELVTAFVNNHQLTASELPTLLTEVFNAVSSFGAKNGLAADLTNAAPPTSQVPAPVSAKTIQALSVELAPPPPLVPMAAVSIEESIRDPDFILSLITGQKFKTLKRHLRAHGLSEAEYRQRFNLPGDYPLVAPSYSQTRRNVARNMGLGRRNGSAPAKAEMPETAVPVRPEIQAPAVAKSKASAPGRGKAKSKPQAATKIAKPKSAAPAQRSAADRQKPAATGKRAAIKPPSEAAGKPLVSAANSNGKAKRVRRGKLSPVFS